MQLNITARHVKLTPAISDYLQKKLQKADRYCEGLIWAQAILGVDKSRHIAELVIHASGRTFMAQEESVDLYAAIDLASDKLDAQLRRFKDKRRVHRPERGKRSRGREAWAELPESPPLSEQRVSSMRVLRLVAQSLDEAIRTMDQSDSAHWIFLNKVNDRVTVVYRKPDKTFGVVESIT